MYSVIIVFHVLACIFLIFIILIQAGRGGGLSEAFGGGSATQTVFGAKTAAFVIRMSIIFATLFLLTSISLTVITARRKVSLMERFTEGVELQFPEEQVIEEFDETQPQFPDENQTTQEE